MTLCRVGEAMGGYCRIENNALNESCLYNIFATISCCVKMEMVCLTVCPLTQQDTLPGKGSDRMRWRNLVLRTYDSLYKNSAAKGLKAVPVQKLPVAVSPDVSQLMYNRCGRLLLT